MKKLDHSGKPTAGASSTSMIAVPRRWLLAGLGAIVVPWLVVGAIYMTGPAAPPMVAPESAPVGPPRTAAQGPWGQLSVTPIIVSPPLEYVAADWGRDEQQPYLWYFPGTSLDVLRTFLSSTGLTAEQVLRLEATARRDERIRGLTLEPDLAMLRSLDPQVRARLYLQLGRSHLNADQGNSLRFFGASADDWLSNSLIAPATRQLIEPLIYRDGDIMHFADAAIVRAEIPDANERQKVAKTLLRQPTMLVRLTVSDSSQVPALAQYWGRGGRSTDVRPLLESVAGASRGGEIDIVHLLPAFARNRLYRYPRITTGDLEKPALANCLWTALNFFGEEPDDRFLDVNTALASMRQDYHIVESDYQLGDIIALLDGEGDLYHVVVYLADDLVFTKNGTSPVSPWTIMPLQRVKDYYRSHSQDPRLIYHRPNDF